MTRRRSNWVPILLLLALGSNFVYERYPQKLLQLFRPSPPFAAIPFRQNPSYQPRLESFAADTGTAKIVFLGDSHFSEVQWSRLLNNNTIHNQGIAGDITRGMLARLEYVKNKNPDMVVLMAGINDILTGREDSAATHIENIIQKLNAEDIHIVLLSTLPVSAGFSRSQNINQKVHSLNDQLSTVCKQYQCTWINASGTLSPQGYLPDSLSHDGVHLKAAGIQAITTMLQPLLPEYPDDL